MSELADFLAALAAEQGSNQLQLVPGTVTALSPLTVTVAGSSTTAASVKRLTGYVPAVSDVVIMLREGPSFLIIGTVGSTGTGTGYKGLVSSAIVDVSVQGPSSASAVIDKTIFDVVAPANGWVEVVIGTVYYGFSGGNVTSARGGLYSNNLGTQPSGGVWQSYTDLGGAVAGATWTAILGSPVILIAPVTAGVSTGVIFRGSWTASPAANCWFAGMASCKLYAS